MLFVGFNIYNFWILIKRTIYKDIYIMYHISKMFYLAISLFNLPITCLRYFYTTIKAFKSIAQMCKQVRLLNNLVGQSTRRKFTWDPLERSLVLRSTISYGILRHTKYLDRDQHRMLQRIRETTKRHKMPLK